MLGSDHTLDTECLKLLNSHTSLSDLHSPATDSHGGRSRRRSTSSMAASFLSAISSRLKRMTTKNNVTTSPSPVSTASAASGFSSSSSSGFPSSSGSESPPRLKRLASSRGSVLRWLLARILLVSKQKKEEDVKGKGRVDAEVIEEEFMMFDGEGNPAYYKYKVMVNGK